MAGAVLFAVAPSIEDVSSTDQADFLPKDAPFVHAQEVYEQVILDDFSPSNTLVLIEVPEGVDVREPEI